MLLLTTPKGATLEEGLRQRHSDYKPLPLLEGFAVNPRCLRSLLQPRDQTCVTALAKRSPGQGVPHAHPPRVTSPPRRLPLGQERRGPAVGEGLVAVVARWRPAQLPARIGNRLSSLAGRLPLPRRLCVGHPRGVPHVRREWRQRHRGLPARPNRPADGYTKNTYW